ncbi:Rho binding incomplete domain containing protein [Pandoravirus dulcis]|uniref:Rho binding incomplete domain containing protein n=1 Tax=Pandoravirus dulcis TaxID=1349409 RepID=A0A291AU73_9VIRU|nr:Rho binding incomplete domain containing protein [Pandoravirus dulcis]ATE82534.1 Rho binding incomplete domain containing protein [Pandoravirus dulcis]
MSAKTRKSGPSGPLAGPSTDRARDRPPMRAIGDGDGDDDWAPPRAPSKPVLTICMDTRRQAGRRGARVSISAAAPAPVAKTAGAAGSVLGLPASVGPAPTAVEPAAPPARVVRSCPWARPPTNPNAPDAVAVPGVSKARAPVDSRQVVESARTGDANPNTSDGPRAPSAEPRVDSQGDDDNGDNRRRLGNGRDDHNDHNDHNTSADRNRAARKVDTHAGDREDNADKGHSLRDNAQDRRDPCDDAKKANPAAQGEDRRTHTDRRRREPGFGAKGPRMQWCRRDASLIAKTQERERLTRRLIGALVGRPYGLTLSEVTTLAEEVLDRPCTMHDARLLVSELPRDMVVVRRMMTPWFVPRTAVALDTRVALDRVVAPAVSRALWQRGAGAGIDIRHLDVSVLTNTGTSLRVHSVNYANGSIRGLLGMLPGVVGRIEDIATRTVVYPAQHMRATALFAPLDEGDDRAGAAETKHAQDEAHYETIDTTRREQQRQDAITTTAEPNAPTESGSTPAHNGACDAAVSRAARVTVVLVETVDGAAAACAHATEAAVASGAPVVVDARGLMAGRHARGPPIGLLQIGVPGGGPVYHLDMVGLHGAWFADPAHGHAVGSSELFAALGIAALLGDPRVIKAAFDSRLLVQMFWRRASCSVVNVFDLGLAARALGAQVRNGWSENDVLAVVGMTIDANANELEAMSATDAWAWHRRPLAPRARAAAARQAVTLARAYQKVNPTLAADEATDEAAA